MSISFRIESMAVNKTDENPDLVKQKNTSGLRLRTGIFFLVTASTAAFCHFHTRTRTHMPRTTHTTFLNQRTYNCRILEDTPLN